MTSKSKTVWWIAIGEISKGLYWTCRENTVQMQGLSFQKHNQCGNASYKFFHLVICSFKISSKPIFQRSSMHFYWIRFFSILCDTFSDCILNNKHWKSMLVENLSWKLIQNFSSMMTTISFAFRLGNHLFSLFRY